ncbi:YeeE/YedE family protein [Wenxinia saemankumensis]|uniref:Sulphur transport domain-containing protein n=1 Tax=Wenxinia saemankumensis TaxID=1447782 RepID=A0A1M6ERQ9_9RHOB|nr:hypothetical protein [Wenxinia saemankumensis]SHI88105.1 hypothetical protein SAMN05444417_2138 [Wenxinia saemankumensis]
MTPPILTEFTPWQALGGGALIGLAAVLLMALHGRILGATGIAAGILPGGGTDKGWRIAIVAGMATAPLAWLFATGAMPVVAVPVPLAMIALGGLIVGFGVSYSSGCTSGHGVCGIARLSPRSIVATLTFMASAFATVFVIRHLIGA